MPFIDVKTNINLTDETKLNLRKEIENHIVFLHKSSNWLMVNITDNSFLSFNNSSLPCCYVEVKTYSKINYHDADNFSKEVTKSIISLLNIPSDRIYVSYFDTDIWSFDGSNF